MIARILTFPLILILAGMAAIMMLLPAIDALMRNDSSVARAFGYSAILGMATVMIIGLAMSGRARREVSDSQNLVSLLLAYLILPLFLAVPFYEGVGNTTHQARVADAVEVAGFAGLRGVPLVCAERRCPDLHRVDPGGLRFFAEHDHRSVVEDRVSVTPDRRDHFLAHDVVRQEDRTP